MDEFDYRSQTGSPLKEEFVKLMNNLRAASSRTLGLLALFAAAFASRSIAGPLYTFTAINDPLEDPAYGTTPGGINNGGQIVGYYGAQGFLYQGGTFTTLNVPGAIETEPTAINDAGQIVGYYATTGSALGFLDNSGTFTTINHPLSNGNFLTGINNAGQIVGYYVDAVGASEGFLYYGGTYTTIDDPLAGSIGTQISGINNAGQIVGYYYDAGGSTHGFLYSGGIFTTIDYLSGGTELYGINDAGQIIGQASGIGNFLYYAGTFTHVPDDPLASNPTTINGINDAGQIVGYYYPNTTRGFTDGFLATPTASTPEPSTLAMTFAALLGIAAYQARKWRL
jgi:probable HAF family extracellular repeat protein